MGIWQALLNKKGLFAGVLLFLFWLLLSPVLNGQAVIAGLMVTGGVMLYNRDLFFDESETSLMSLGGVFGLLRFVCILIAEILKANVQVAKIVLSPTMPISPCYVKVPVRQKKVMNQVLYANSITLTPGTLSVDMNAQEILIHALTKEAAEGMEGNILEASILKLEEGPHGA